MKIEETLPPGGAGRGEIAGWWDIVTSGLTLGHVWKVQNTRLVCSYFIQDCLQVQDTNLPAGILYKIVSRYRTQDCLKVQDTNLFAGTRLQICNLQVQDTR